MLSTNREEWFFNIIGVKVFKKKKKKKREKKKKKKKKKKKVNNNFVILKVKKIKKALTPTNP